MRIRLGYLLEVVVVLGVGMALARWDMKDAGTTPYFRNGGIGRYAFNLVEPTLAGIALAGGIALWWEAWRGQSPPLWRIGRWTWSVAALSVVLTTIGWSGMQMGTLWRNQYQGSFINAFLNYSHQPIGRTFFHQTGWVLAAACVASRIAGCPRDPAPDAREWSGRVLLAAIISWTVAYFLISVLGLSSLRPSPW